MHREAIQDPYVRLAGWIVLGTIPAVIAGVALKDIVEAAFGSPLATSGFLLVTAALLLAAERIGKRLRSLDTATWKDAVWIGLAQALALFPGSRDRGRRSPPDCCAASIAPVRRASRSCFRSRS